MIMKKIYFIITILFFSSAVYCQTNNLKAKKYFDSGCDEVSKKVYAAAVTDFSVAIELDPYFVQAYENRGVARFYLQDYKGAIDDYDKALQINPTDYNTLGRRGWAKFYLQDYQGAVADFTVSVEGSSDKSRFLNMRGQAKYRLQDYDGANADFSEVIKSWSSGNDEKGKAYYWRGMIEIEVGRKDSGCTDLTKARKSGYAAADEEIKRHCHDSSVAGDD